eukprot:Unigene10058_Nuclearia_a/m.30709 Unigene10058_Nuclearia_a/g.30709  ORF Unigene10058_Nuclearia_a/g.30709 Unigene10058_Nuclearia_a/m.30709 type:complete len:122 (-) Unigene10058_Nuclearia_a:176-541(-)
MASPAAASAAKPPPVATKPPVPSKKPPVAPKPLVGAAAPKHTATSEQGAAVAFNNKLKGFAWRIDVKTKSKHIKELNEPAAIVELDVRGLEDKIVRFELDAREVADVVAQLMRIEAAINST